MRGGVTDAGQTTNKRQTVKIELLSQWKLEAEFRNFSTELGFQPYKPFILFLTIQTIYLVNGYHDQIAIEGRTTSDNVGKAPKRERWN